MNKRIACCIVACLLVCLSAIALAQDIDYSEYTFCEDIPRWTPDPYYGQYPATTQAPVAVTTGQPISVEGNVMTRDLLFDKHTNKQFVTLETRKGNPFFLVIDYDKPRDAAGEQFDTFFLNKVDEADLMSLLDDKEKESLAQSCICKTQCQPGTVNTACPVCSKNMSECKGTAPTPTPRPAPSAEPEPTPPAPENKGAGMSGVILLAVLAAAGGAFFYFKRSKRGSARKQPGIIEYEDEYTDEQDEDTEETMDEEEPS